jgi:signal transduction histidine kinase
MAGQIASALENARLYEEVQQELTERKRAEEALHSALAEAECRRQMLLALNEAAQAVQRARIPDKVCQSIGDSMARMGYNAIIFALTDDGEHLTGSHMTFEPALRRAVEELTGLAGDDCRIPLTPGGFYQRVIAEGETIFSEDPGPGPIAEALPRSMRSLAGQLAALLGVEKAIYIPLQVSGETRGLLTVIGANLTEADVPAMETFASQASIALENARLFEQMQADREQMSRLARQVISAQEEERQRISQELHDELAQALTAIAFDLTTIEQDLPPDLAPDIKDRLARAALLIDQIDERVSEIALELRPFMLDDLGLASALRWYMNRYTQRLGIEVQMEAIDLEDSLPAEVSTTIYRVVQEALTNVARHAQADTVRLHLECKESAIVASIEDNGRGFEVKESTDPRGSECGAGLLGIQDRVNSLGGSFSIQSQAGEGTRLKVNIPI